MPPFLIKYAIYAVLVAALVGAGLLWLREHDNHTRDVFIEKQKTAIAEEKAASAERVAAVHQQEAESAQRRAVQVVHIKDDIANAPVTMACKDNAAVTAALHGLRATVDPNAVQAGPAPPGDVAMHRRAPDPRKPH